MSDKEKAALGFYINSKDWGDGDKGEITAFKVQAAESWKDGRLSKQEEIEKLKTAIKESRTMIYDLVDIIGESDILIHKAKDIRTMIDAGRIQAELSGVEASND